MTITHFPHGIIATPNLGSVGFGMGYLSTTYFVDGVNGSDSQDGQSPEAAFVSVGKAISMADAWDVIYVLPKAWTSLGAVDTVPWVGTPYQESSTDLSVTYAKQGLAIIGVGHQGLIGPPYGTVIRGIAANTASLLKVHAPMVAIENLTFASASADSNVDGLEFNGETALTSEGSLGSVYNCHFHSCGKYSGYEGGAVHATMVWGLTVDTCSFQGCRTGVGVHSAETTTGKFIVRNCDFFSRLGTASDIYVDISIYNLGSTSVLITGNNFAHLIPSYTNAGGWILIYDDRMGLVSNNHFAGQVGITYTQGYAGTGINVCGPNADTRVGLGANYCNGALMPVVAV